MTQGVTDNFKPKGFAARNITVGRFFCYIGRYNKKVVRRYISSSPANHSGFCHLQ